MTAPAERRLLAILLRLATAILLTAMFAVVKLADARGVTLFESLFLCTPGKILLNMRVQSNAGKHPATKHVLIRNLARFIPGEALTFLSEFRLHDKLSQTSIFKYK